MADVTLHAKTRRCCFRICKTNSSREPSGRAPERHRAHCQLPATPGQARAVGMPVIYVRVSRRLDLKDAPRPPWARRPAVAGLLASLKARTVRRSSRNWHPDRRTSSSPSIPPAPSIPPILGSTSGGSASRP